MNIYSMIREQPWYRREAFARGAAAAGHRITHGLPREINKETVLLIWNRYGSGHEAALQVEQKGGIVLVAENGYLGAGGTSPKFDVHPRGPESHHYYALARQYHNDGSVIKIGAEDRFSKLGIELKPLREDGGYILICPNRSFGIEGRMMHPDWAAQAQHRWGKAQSLPVRVRTHPGNDAPKRTIHDELKGAAKVVVWSSSAGVHALCEGIPVVCDAPYWICKSTDCDIALKTMSWAQWTLAEIESGKPFDHILSNA